MGCQNQPLDRFPAEGEMSTRSNFNNLRKENSK